MQPLVHPVLTELPQSCMLAKARCYSCTEMTSEKELEFEGTGQDPKHYARFAQGVFFLNVHLHSTLPTSANSVLQTAYLNLCFENGLPRSTES